MSLYLVQHGQSLPKDVDPERGLSTEGIKEVKQIAALAREHEIPLVRIEHSGKRRALQTAEIFAEALKPPDGVHQRDGLNPNDDVRPIASSLRAGKNLMLVGHLPFLDRLASFLLIGGTERSLCRFQNGGIVCLDQNPETGTWFLKWTLMPKLR